MKKIILFLFFANNIFSFEITTKLLKSISYVFEIYSKYEERELIHMLYHEIEEKLDDTFTRAYHNWPSGKQKFITQLGALIYFDNLITKNFTDFHKNANNRIKNYKELYLRYVLPDNENSINQFNSDLNEIAYKIIPSYAAKSKI